MIIIMKNIEYIIKKLVFLSVFTVFASLTASHDDFVSNQNTIEEQSHHAVEVERGISIASPVQEIPYSINSDLSFTPYNNVFYQTIINELLKLKHYYSSSKVISLAQPEAQRCMPTLYPILKDKFQAIAQRMNLDTEAISLCIQPTSTDSKQVFNAHAQTVKNVSVYKESKVLVDKKGAVVKTLETKITPKVSTTFNLTLNEETITLFAWHEGDFAYTKHEGLIDGVIAHELGHIFHKHTLCDPTCELQADTTGARALKQSTMLLNAVDMLYFAGNVYSFLLANKETFKLTLGEIFTAINTISSSLMKANGHFGFLSLCASHSQFTAKIQHALTKSYERITEKKAFTNKEIKVSLLYDELKDSCNMLELTTGTNTKIENSYKILDQVMALYSPLTHPDPRTRRLNLAWTTH